MKVSEVKKELEQIADRIDSYLGELESTGKDNTAKYEKLLYIAGGIRELINLE